MGDDIAKSLLKGCLIVIIIGAIIGVGLFFILKHKL